MYMRIYIYIYMWQFLVCFSMIKWPVFFSKSFVLTSCNCMSNVQFLRALVCAMCGI